MEEQIRIMLVEDDEILAREMKSFLDKWNYRTNVVVDFSDVLKEFTKCHPHLILMDVNLPYFDGFYWCQKIREVSEVPIIYVSSRNDDRDKIMAIAQGGDDFIEKPFHLELLKAKIDAILRRAYQYKVKDRIYLQQDLYFEEHMSALIYQEKEVELTKSEKKILGALMKERPKVVTRDELMQVLWSTNEFVSDSTLTTLISRLRTKLDAICGIDMIKTRKGQGYYIA